MKKDPQLREAALGYDGTDKNLERNMFVNIELKASLPIISLSQSSGPGSQTTDQTVPENIEYNQSIASAILPAFALEDIKNILVDPDDVNRYVPIAVIGSMVNSIEAVIYYDADMKDLFLIPTLTDMGDTLATRDFLSSNTITIEGYGIGVSGERGVDQRGLTLPYYYSPIDGIDGSALIPNETKSHLLQIPGASRNSTTNNRGLMLGDSYIETNVGTPVEMSSLGSTLGLLGDVKVPTFRYVRTGFNSYSLIFVGHKQLDDMLIPLPS